MYRYVTYILYPFWGKPHFGPHSRLKCKLIMIFEVRRGVGKAGWTQKSLLRTHLYNRKYLR